MEVTQTTSSIDFINPSKKSKVADNKSSFDMSKPFDINTFTFEDFKNISKEDLVKWTEKDENIKDIHWLKMMTTFTEDETLNKTLFNKAKESHIKTGNIDEFFRNVITPLTLMNTPMKPLEENSELFFRDNPDIFNNKSRLEKNQIPTKKEANSDDLLSDLRKFPSWYENAKTKEGFTIHIDMQASIDYMNDILKNYKQKISENNAALEQYTRNTRQVTI